MIVLVAVASRHGSTREIAEQIAEGLHDAGVEPELREVAEVVSLAGYGAVVLGSAIYAGRWLPGAREFVARNRDQLLAIPVWFFSSGPTSAEPSPPGEPSEVAELARQVGARDHTVFAGKLDSRNLGFAERLITKVAHAPTGDLRNWETIRAWSREIGLALAGHPLAGRVGEGPSKGGEGLRPGAPLLGHREVEL